MCKKSSWLLVVFALAFGPQTVLAQQKSPKKTPKSQPAPREPAAPEGDFAKAKALYERGDAFYKLGEYEKALYEFQEAYLVSKAPLLLLNIAQCYRYLGKYEEAKHSYEAYVREDPNGPYHQEMLTKIEEMKTILAAKQREMGKPSSLVVTVQSPGNEGKRTRTWLLGGAIGTALLGGVALTLVLSADANNEPQTSLGGQFVGF